MPSSDTYFSSTYQPKKRKTGIQIKSLMKKKVMAEIEPMLTAIIEKIKKTGDGAELDRLLNRVMGKVKEHIEHTGSIEFQHVEQELQKIVEDDGNTGQDQAVN